MRQTAPKGAVRHGLISIIRGAWNEPDDGNGRWASIAGGIAVAVLGVAQRAGYSGELMRTESYSRSVPVKRARSYALTMTATITTPVV